MHLLSDSSGAVVCYEAFIHEIPQVLPGILLDYVEKRALWSIFDGCIDGSIQPGIISVEDGDYDWFIERRPLPEDCDMHWISPANARTHEDLLEHMGSGRISDLMNAIGSISPPHVTRLVIYQLTFAVVSHWGSVRLHSDNDESLSGEAWTVILPLRVVEASEPELIVQNLHTKAQQHVKYNVGTAVIFGPHTFHSTAALRYTNTNRVCLIVSIAHITKANVSALLEDVSNLYPSKKDNALLMRWSRKPHWKVVRGKNTCAIPTCDDDVIFGRYWSKMFALLESVKNATGSFIVADGNQSGVQLRRWISAQRHNYSMKYATSKSDYSIKIGRMMTFAREAKLKSIGFQFKISRESGINQSKWMDKFLQAEDFFIANGHCMIMPSHDVPRDLVSWVWVQRIKLKHKTNLSEVQLERRNMLKSIGFLFSIYEK